MSVLRDLCIYYRTWTLATEWGFCSDYIPAASYIAIQESPHKLLNVVILAIGAFPS